MHVVWYSPHNYQMSGANTLNADSQIQSMWSFASPSVFGDFPAKTRHLCNGNEKVAAKHNAV